MKSISQTKVAILFGGISSEHAPSVHMFDFLCSELSAHGIEFASCNYFYLRLDGKVEHFTSCDAFRLVDGIVAIDGARTIDRSAMLKMVADHDMFIFSLMQGGEGEDGSLQGAAEFLALRSNLGSVSASYLSIDKYVFALLVNRRHPIALTPIRSTLILPDVSDDELKKYLAAYADCAVIVKPNRQGASVLTKASLFSTPAELIACCHEIHRSGDQVLLQEYIPGVELTCGCIRRDGEWQALDCMEVESQRGMMGAEEKSGSSPYTRRQCPDPEINKAVKHICADLASWFGFHTQCRFDLKHNEGRLYMLECNSKPGLLRSSIYVEMLSRVGLSVRDLMRITFENERRTQRRSGLKFGVV